MLVLVTHGLPSVLQMRERLGPVVGRLFTPRHLNAVDATVEAGVPWAADNDAFGAFDPSRFATMVSALAGHPGGRFVAIPDEVGDARLTLQRFETWAPAVRDSDLRVGFVVQNGIEAYPVPWAEVDAVFIGGDDAFKLGPSAAGVVREANERGLWTHMGRVNSLRRLKYAASIGCDSIDGSGWARFRDAMMPLLHALPYRQGRMAP